jgi:hypothetical protein
MVNKIRKCKQEHCVGTTEKVLFKKIFPLRLCSNRNCNSLYGFWGFMTWFIHHDGTFIKYEGHPYWSSVISYFKGEIK